jgi:hypothetical protein
MTGVGHLEVSQFLGPALIVLADDEGSAAPKIAQPHRD